MIWYDNSDSGLISVVFCLLESLHIINIIMLLDSLESQATMTSSGSYLKMQEDTRLFFHSITFKRAVFQSFWFLAVSQSPLNSNRG